MALQITHDSNNRTAALHVRPPAHSALPNDISPGDVLLGELMLLKEDDKVGRKKPKVAGAPLLDSLFCPFSAYMLQSFVQAH